MINTASFVAAYRMVNTQKNYEQALFNKAADKYSNGFKQAIAASFDIAQVAQALFISNNNNVSREKFKLFSNIVLKGHPEIQALNWLPRITHAQRKSYEQTLQREGFDPAMILEYQMSNQLMKAKQQAFYYPLHYLEPFEKNKKAFRLNSYSNHESSAAIDLITTQQDIAISGPTTLVQEYGNEKGILIFYPVYQQQQQLGLVEVVLRMDTFLTFMKNKFNMDESIQVYLYEITAQEKIPLSSMLDINHHGDFYYKLDFLIAQKKWQLAFFPSAILSEKVANQQDEIYTIYMIRSVGISLIISILLFILLYQKQRAEKNARIYKRAELRLKQLMNQMTNGYLLHDMQGKILEVNRRSCDLLGYSQQVLQTLFIEDISPLSEDQLHMIWSQFKLGETQVMQGYFRHQQGHLIAIESRVNCFLLKGEWVFSSLSRDITEELKYKQSLTAAKLVAEQANKAKSEFLSNMTHELRTPLHGILSYANFGIENIDKENKAKNLKYFQRIDTCGQRLLVLINDVLDLSKLELGKMVMNVEQHNVQTLCQNCLNEQELRLTALNLTVNVDVLNDTSAICDAPKITQVITNLLSNAIKFSPTGGQIWIKLEHGKLDNMTALSVSIADEGVGIPQGELEHIFERFIESSQTKNNAGGTGLGLSICTEIIKLHRGKIWAEHRETGGTIFKFLIPIY